MTTTRSRRAKPAQSETATHAAKITAQLAELETMTTAELAQKWFEVLGDAARSRNRGYLVKRIAYRIQEVAEGGLSARALSKVEELAPTSPIRRRARPRREGAPAAEVASDRDPRLPPVGTVLRPRYKGAEFAIEVLSEGFEFDGKVYKSLSAAAKAATGVPINPFIWCGLNKKGGDA